MKNKKYLFKTIKIALISIIFLHHISKIFILHQAIWAQWNLHWRNWMALSRIPNPKRWSVSVEEKITINLLNQSQIIKSSFSYYLIDYLFQIRPFIIISLQKPINSSKFHWFWIFTIRLQLRREYPRHCRSGQGASRRQHLVYRRRQGHSQPWLQ